MPASPVSVVSAEQTEIAEHASVAPAGDETEPAPPLGHRRLYAAGLVGATLLASASLAPAEFLPSLTILVLAAVLAVYVNDRAHHALHSPLMSVTHAISGVILVGAILQAPLDDLTLQVLAGVAILLASLNVLVGFLITRRILDLLQQG